MTGGIGGPTLVTDQRDDAKRLARNGWLVAPVAGRVAVFDGADVSAGPVAKIFLKHRVPHGLHGAFVPRRERTEPRSSERSVRVKK